MPHPLEYQGNDVATNASSNALRFSAPLLTFLTILSTWALTVFGLVLIPLPILFAAGLAIRRRWGLLALCAALSPVCVGFVAGAVGYTTGTARIEGMGLPGPGYINLDPDLRCERSTGGCLVNGGEFLTQGPNNFAVVVLTRLFGPQRSAYTGPYPNESQAKAALAAATPVSLELLRQDAVDVTQPSVNLDAGVGAGLLRPTVFSFNGSKLDDFSQDWLKTVGPASATLYRNRCLILRLPMTEASAMIVLLDTQTGRPFAYYGEGQFHQRVPPVMWRK